jgi:phosphohistidine phosphatase SixA
MARYIIAVRHCHYSTKGMENPLSRRGKKEARKLRGKIADFVARNFSPCPRVLVISSDAKRAEKTAKIICGKLWQLDIVRESHDLFYSPSDFPGFMWVTRGKIKNVDLIILVAHEEFLSSFSRQYFKNSSIPDQEISMGEGYVLNLASGETNEL